MPKMFEASMITTSSQFGLWNEQPANLPIENDLRNRFGRSLATSSPMIPEAIRSEILSRMQSAEREHGARVLLAVESGSRAWGFESPDSDYDVRFIYANQPDWYLSIDLEDKRDVIEYPIIDDIDLPYSANRNTAI